MTLVDGSNALGNFPVMDKARRLWSFVRSSLEPYNVAFSWPGQRPPNAL